VELLQVESEGKSAREVENSFIEALDGKNIEGKIVLLKTKGTLRDGKPSDVDWKRITSLASERGALTMKKSVHLNVKDTEIVKPTASNIEAVETEVIEKNAGDDKDKVLRLMEALNVEKGEDEKNYIYEEKIKSNMRKVLGV